MDSKLSKIIFVNTHPIQYFAPLYSYCNKVGLQVDAWYLSDESIKGSKDVQFGKEIKWDIPLLEGYNYRFFKNHSWKPSIHAGFFGVINLGLIKALFKEQKSFIIVHGWGHLGQLMTIFFAKIAGHKVGLRGETPLKQEKMLSPFKLMLRKILLKHLMFRFVDKFFYIGKENAAFYNYYGVQNKDLVFIPYAVDNDRFNRAYQVLKFEKQTLKQELAIPANHFVIVYSGKYIDKKRPLDLLKAFHLLNAPDASLVMVGEGELRKELEQYIAHNAVSNVHLTGFINQSLIPKYYAIGDVFAMCSQEGETWGLSVNEAMNFALPIVASDLVGCTDDLIDSGENGFIYNCGNVKTLSVLLGQLYENRAMVESMGQKSKNKISEYSFSVIKNNLEKVL